MHKYKKEIENLEEVDLVVDNEFKHEVLIE